MGLAASCFCIESARPLSGRCHLRKETYYCVPDNLGQFGTARHSVSSGPGLNITDLALHKIATIKGHWSFVQKSLMSLTTHSLTITQWHLFLSKSLGVDAPI